MKNFKFKKFISEANEENFQKICAKLEKTISNLQEEILFNDIDGSAIKMYQSENGEIRINNSYYIGDLYVESDFDLGNIFD